MKTYLKRGLEQKKKVCLFYVPFGSNMVTRFTVVRVLECLPSHMIMVQ